MELVPYLLLLVLSSREDERNDRNRWWICGGEPFDSSSSPSGGSEPRTNPRKGRFTLTLSLFRGSSVPFVCQWCELLPLLLVLYYITTHSWFSCFSATRNLLFDLFRTSVLLPFFDSQPQVLPRWPGIGIWSEERSKWWLFGIWYCCGVWWVGTGWDWSSVLEEATGDPLVDLFRLFPLLRGSGVVERMDVSTLQEILFSSREVQGMFTRHERWRKRLPISDKSSDLKVGVMKYNSFYSCIRCRYFGFICGSVQEILLIYFKTTFNLNFHKFPIVPPWAGKPSL